MVVLLCFRVGGFICGVCLSLLFLISPSSDASERLCFVLVSSLTVSLDRKIALNSDGALNCKIVCVLSALEQ